MKHKVGVVSVVIPAYNAAATLDATLESVRAQTYQEIEIVVVDDGSTDNTGEIARAHAAVDPRIVVLRIENSGVGSARNAGIARSTGEFVAPVDADDIWHPEKIARQVAAIRRCGEDTGFVYAYYRRIDSENRVVRNGQAFPIEGHIFLRSLVYNPAGNGSSMLARRDAVDAVGGYETDRSLQASADSIIQLKLGRQWKVGVVPEYLVGYRVSAGSMSGNAASMAKVRLAVLRYMEQLYPEIDPEILRAAKAKVLAEDSARALAELDLRAAVLQLHRGARLSPFWALGLWATFFLRNVARGFARLPSRLGIHSAREPADFYSFSPRSRPVRLLKPPGARLVAWAAARELQYARGAGRGSPPPEGSENYSPV